MNQASMIKLKSALNPEVAKLIYQRYPVTKKRTALWFFSDEIKKKWLEDSKRDHCWMQKHGAIPAGGEKKLKRADILSYWNKMDPESKRKYFNMSELDGVRYKEQKSLWIAEVSSLMAKHGNELKKLTEMVPDLNQSEQEDLELDKYKKGYECMVQSTSTKKIYSSLIDKLKNLDFNVATEQLISAVPEDYRPILSRPRRPPPPFVIYTCDNRKHLASLRREKYPKLSFLRVAGLEWAKADSEVRDIYETKYINLMEEYSKAMGRFKDEVSNSEDSYLEQASREKRAFRKSLRRRMRDFVPINVRNAFNFFAMEHKGVPLLELIKLWKELPEEKKQRYQLLNKQDSARYYVEKSAYEHFLKDLNQVEKKASEANCQ